MLVVAMRDDVEPARPLLFERPLQRLRETVEVVRAVGEHAATAVPELQRALLAGRAAANGRVRPQMPHPSLEPALR